MNMKLKLLAGTVSLLCFGQGAMAEIQSTVTLNGITHTFTFATQAEAQAAATNPTFDQIQFFADAQGNLPSNGIGAITRSIDTTKPNDPPVIIFRTAAKEVIVQKVVNGVVDSIVIDTGTVNQLNNTVLTYLTATDPATVVAANPKIITSAVTNPDAFAKVQTETQNAITKITAAKPSTSADAASQTTQLAAIQSLNAAVQATLNTTEFVTSTVVLNGISHTYVFADQAKAQDAANNPQRYAGDFNGATSVIGMVTQNTYKGQTAVLVRTGFNSAIVGLPQADGSIKYSAVSGNTFTGVNANVAKFLNGDTSVVTTIDQATAQKLVQYLATAKATPNISSTLSAQLQQALASAQALIIPVTPPVAEANLKQLRSAAAAIGTAEANRDMNAAIAQGDAAVVALLARMQTNKYAAQNSRSSGIAGNPVSIMNMTVDSMFNQAADYGQTANKVNIASASSDGGVKTTFSAGLQYGYYDLDGRSANVVSLPLSVSTQFNPKGELILSVPLSYVQTQNQTDAYQVGVNLGYKYNVNDNWSITPAASYAYRSFDSADWNNALRTDTSMVGGSVSSKYTWNLQASALRISLTNMIGYYESLDNGAGNTISNYVTKNGLHATKSLGNFMVGAYFTDTEYFGSKRSLYFDQFNEVGLSLKPQNSGALDALSVDANYLFNIGGNHSGSIDGFRLNLGYKF